MGRSFVKTVDFAIAKDGYKFNSVSGMTAYVLGILYINIIIINLVIALVSDVYDGVMNVRNETEIKLKAELLQELYNLQSVFWR